MRARVSQRLLEPEVEDVYAAAALGRQEVSVRKT
jgi:hypothetical protein